MTVPGGAYVHLPARRSSAGWARRRRSFLGDGERTGEAFALVDERAARGESVPDGGPSFESVDGAQIGAAAAEYGIEFVGPLPDA